MRKRLISLEGYRGDTSTAYTGELDKNSIGIIPLIPVIASAGASFLASPAGQTVISQGATAISEKVFGKKTTKEISKSTAEYERQQQAEAQARAEAERARIAQLELEAQRRLEEQKRASDEQRKNLLLVGGAALAAITVLSLSKSKR